MKLYVAGPMRGIPLFNFPAFDEAAEQLRGVGHDVFNPADHDRETHGVDFADGNLEGSEAAAAVSHGFDLREALAADLSFIIHEADGVAVLPGWERSKGARSEVSTALALGLTVAPVEAFVDAVVFGEFEAAKVITDLVAVEVPGNATGVEVRTASASGGEKGVKPARMSLLPAYPLALVAEHYGKGAAKYAAHNWRRGYEFSKSFDAMQRHAFAWNDGEDNDPELGTSHLCAVVFHAFTLLQGLRDWPHFDDRYRPELDALPEWERELLTRPETHS